MKQLICEMCGSKDLIKDGGVFVCQSCGCKYTVEEAKKMMIEGTVDVSGSTIKVDSSEKLNNLYMLARRAKNDDNIQDAAKYYHEIRLEDPNSWEAAFYGVYYTALDCKIGQITSAARNIANSLRSIADMIQSNVPQDMQKICYNEYLLQAALGGQMLFNAAKSTYEESTYNDRRSDFIERASYCTTIFLMAADIANVTFDDCELAELLYKSAIEMVESSSVVSHFKIAIEEEREKVKAKLLIIQRRKNKEYWEQHAEEKRKLDERVSEIMKEVTLLEEDLKKYQSQIREIEKELEQQVPAEKQLDELLNQKSNLLNQKSKLGLFAGKQKNLLQEQIDSMHSPINSMREEVEKQRRSLGADVQTRVSAVEVECAPIKEKIEALEKEKSSILEELTKDR